MISNLTDCTQFSSDLVCRGLTCTNYAKSHGRVLTLQKRRSISLKNGSNLFVPFLLQVGKNISTKSCGSEEREDLTDKYKYPEGSVQERAALGAEGDLAKASDVSFAMEFAKK